jgi:hypothetical protein
VFVALLVRVTQCDHCPGWSRAAFQGLDESTASFHLLPNTVRMPRTFFGTAALPRGRAQQRIIKNAIDVGFRAFDTAMATEW